MNKRVVIVWIAFIIIFTLLGIFGLLNQNLVKNKNDDNKIKQIVMKTCSNELDDETYTYTFILEDDEVQGLKYEYKSDVNDDDKLSIARRLSNADIEGLTVAYNFYNPGFDITITSNIKILDTTKLSDFTNDLLDLEVIFDTTKDFESYEENITNINSMNFICNAK